MSNARRLWGGSSLFPRLPFNCADCSGTRLCGTSASCNPDSKVSRPALHAPTDFPTRILRLSSSLHFYSPSIQALPRVSVIKSTVILPRFFHKASGFPNPVFRSSSGRFSPLFWRGEWGFSAASGKKVVDIQTGLWYKLVEFRVSGTPEIEFESAVVGLWAVHVQDFHNERR